MKPAACQVRDQFCGGQAEATCARCKQPACDACRVDAACHTCLRAQGKDTLVQAHLGALGGTVVRKQRRPLGRFLQ